MNWTALTQPAPQDSLAWRWDRLTRETSHLLGQTTIARTDWHLHEVGDQRKPWLTLKIESGAGDEGWCTLPPWHKAPLRQSHRDRAEAMLVGADPFDRQALWRRLREQGIPLVLLSYVDVALWDMLGRRMGRSIHALLGTRRRSIRAYRSTQFNVGGPDQYAALALDCRQRGYAGCKFHPNRDWAGPNDPDDEIAIYRAARAAVGEDYPLMADPFLVHDYDSALRVGRVVDELGFAWYESPMPESDDWIARYAMLAKEIRTPLVGGECATGSWERRLEWLAAGASVSGRLDVFNGGLTACLAIAAACERLGAWVDLHCAMAPHAQVFAATDEAVIPYVEDYGTPLWAPMGSDGRVPIGDEPGADAKPDEAALAEHRISWDLIETAER